MNSGINASYQVHWIKSSYLKTAKNENTKTETRCSHTSKAVIPIHLRISSNLNSMVSLNVCKCNTKSILFVNTFTCLLCPTTFCTMSLFTEARNRFFYILRQYLKKKHSYMITAVMNIYFKTFSYTSQFHKKLEGPYLLFIRRFKLNVCRTE